MAAETFAPALALLLEHEGGFVDHPDDPGGATNRGITQATLGRARGAPATEEDVRLLQADEAAAIYRRHYWDAVRADDLPPGIDLAVFDCAVNAGPGRAVRLLQRVLGVPADGIVGPVTLAASRRADPASVIRRYGRARLGFLRRLAIWPVFRRGWRRRVLAVERAALRLAGRDSSTTTQKGPTMFDSKSILASRTVWTNLIGLMAVGLGAFGLDTSSLDGPAFAEAAVQLVAAGSFIASTVFRIVATKQLLS
jgi:lysozyme family protein